MSDNSLTINSSGEGKLSLEFTREKFSEFVTSLLSTPRAERHTFYGGFDLDMDNVKTIVDKVLHKVKTDHDVISDDFAAEVMFSNKTTLNVGDYHAFFHVPDVRSDKVKEVNVTLSLLIPFNRQNNEKNFEKQIIAIRFVAGSIGQLEIEIRSTEISWPAGYFSIIENEWRQLNKNVKMYESKILTKFLFLTPLFTGDILEKNRSKFSAERSRLYLVTAGLILMLLMVSSVFSQIPKSASLYDPTIQALTVVDVDEYLENGDWRQLARDIQLTQTLAQAHRVLHGVDSPQASFINFLSHILLGKIQFVTFGIVFLYIFMTLFYAKLLDASNIGRIFLYQSASPKRPNGNLVFPTINSFITGILASLFASMIINVFRIF
jgi:hypothetical protein